MVGDVKPKAVRALVDKYWGEWKRGSYKPEIPLEPAQEAPRKAQVDWPSPTLPIVAIAYKGPAYNDATKDTAALDALSQPGVLEHFGSVSEARGAGAEGRFALGANAPGSVDAGAVRDHGAREEGRRIWITCATRFWKR